MAGASLVRRVAPAVVEIMGANPGPMTLDGSRTYLLGTGPKRILVDTGEGRPQWREALQSVLDSDGCSVEAVLLTHHHHDHVGGVEDVLSLGSGPVAVFQAGGDATRIEWGEKRARPAALADGQLFEVEGATVRAMFTPGHTPDSTSFVAEGAVLPWGEGRAAFVGDCVLGTSSGVVTDLASQKRSIERIVEARPQALYCGHGTEVAGKAGEAEAWALKMLAHRTSRAEQVIEALSAAGRDGATAVSLAGAVYEKAGMAHVMSDPVLSIAASFQTLVALRFMSDQGRCERVRGPSAASAGDGTAEEGKVDPREMQEANEAVWRATE